MHPTGMCYLPKVKASGKNRSNRSAANMKHGPNIRKNPRSIDSLHNQDIRITILSRYPVCQYTCHGKSRSTGQKGLCWVRYLSGYAQRVDATSNKKKHIRPITPTLLSPVRSSGKADRPVCRLPPCDDADRNHINPAYRPLRRGTKVDHQA